jgi:hypothetical protein
MAATMTAKFPGKCTSCGGRISVGASILWAKGEGARHADCSVAVAPKGGELTGRRIIPMTAARRAIRAAVRGESASFDERYASDPDWY